jgi:hypothetical protein
MLSPVARYGANGGYDMRENKILLSFTLITSILIILFLFTGCESQILPSVMSEAMENALPTYWLTVETEGVGNVNILEPTEVKKGVKTPILATPGNDYVWSHWYVTAGSASFDDPNNRSTKVALQNGDAAICAVFVPDEYLRLSSPIGGESYLVDGPEIEIQWDYNIISGSVDIYLCDEVGTTIDFIGSTSVLTGSYSVDSTDRCNTSHLRSCDGNNKTKA